MPHSNISNLTRTRGHVEVQMAGKTKRRPAEDVVLMLW
jgi:hypothetical protein